MQQRCSGLGIEAQRAAVTRFAKGEGIAIIAEYVEAETGKGADALDRRPQLAAALAAAKTAKCSVLVSKLDRLSPQTRDILEHAAVIGDEFRIETISLTAERREAEITQAIEEGLRSGVLSEHGLSSGEDCRFYHNVLRRVLYETLSVRKRRRLHAQTARALESVYASEPDRVAAAISAQHEAAGDARRTFEWSMRAWQAARMHGHRDVTEVLRSRGARGRMPSNLERVVDATFRDIIHDGWSGAAVLVAQNGKVLLEKGYGLANLEHRVPVTPETRFRIGSISKQFTAASIALLAEAGRLDLFLAGYWSEEVNLWNLKTTQIMPESFEYATNGGRSALGECHQSREPHALRATCRPNSMPRLAQLYWAAWGCVPWG
jgi:hypothetical protein